MAEPTLIFGSELWAQKKKTKRLACSISRDKMYEMYIYIYIYIYI